MTLRPGSSGPPAGGSRRLAECELHRKSPAPHVMAGDGPPSTIVAARKKEMSPMPTSVGMTWVDACSASHFVRAGINRSGQHRREKPCVRPVTLRQNDHRSGHHRGWASPLVPDSVVAMATKSSPFRKVGEVFDLPTGVSTECVVTGPLKPMAMTIRTPSCARGDPASRYWRPARLADRCQHPAPPAGGRRCCGRSPPPLPQPPPLCRRMVFPPRRTMKALTVTARVCPSRPMPVAPRPRSPPGLQGLSDADGSRSPRRQPQPFSGRAGHGSTIPRPTGFWSFRSWYRPATAAGSARPPRPERRKRAMVLTSAAGSVHHPAGPQF